jgi:hypothetical protein
MQMEDIMEKAMLMLNRFSPLEKLMLVLKVGFAFSPLILIGAVLVFASEDEDEEKAKREAAAKSKSCKP